MNKLKIKGTQKFSGKEKSEQTTINLTLSDYVYEKLKKEADEAGVSLNQLIQEKILNINY